MLIIEDYPLENPNQHTQNDTIETLNLQLLTNSTKLTLAIVVHLAQLINYQKSNLNIYLYCFLHFIIWDCPHEIFSRRKSPS